MASYICTLVPPTVTVETSRSTGRLCSSSASIRGVTRGQLLQDGAQLVLGALELLLGGGVALLGLDQGLARALEPLGGARLAGGDRGFLVRDQLLRRGELALRLFEGLVGGDERLVGIALARGVPGDELAQLPGRARHHRLLVGFDGDPVEVLANLLAARRWGGCRRGRRSRPGRAGRGARGRPRSPATASAGAPP